MRVRSTVSYGVAGRSTRVVVRAVTNHGRPLVGAHEAGGLSDVVRLASRQR